MTLVTWLRSLAIGFSIAMMAAAPAGAHPGHGLESEMTPRELAVSSANYVVQTMIERGVLDQSWRNIAPSNAQLRDRAGNTEWLVTFRNAGVADPAHRTLYVILTPMGEYIAANYTGQ